MSESPNKRAIIVGIFILVGISFLAAGILVIGNLHETFSKKIRLVTILEDVNGLQNGNNIWFSGVKIGTVKNIEFYGKSDVKVIMKIDEGVRNYIRKDAKVKVGTDGLIGNKIIVIYGGTSKAGPVASGDTLKVEDGFSTEDILSTLQKNNENILEITGDIKTVTKKLARGEGNAGRFLNEETLYSNLDEMTASLKKASVQAERLLNSLSAFSSKLNKKGTLINDLVTDTTTFDSVKSTVNSLKKTADTAAVMVNNLKSASAGTKSPAGILLYDEQAGTQLKGAIRNLESSSKKLDEDLEALQHSFLLRKYFKKKKKEAK